jgi:hypothetical protein
VEFLELVYEKLEKKSKEMKRQLIEATDGKVSNIEIGVIN